MERLVVVKVTVGLGAAAGSGGRSRTSDVQRDHANHGLYARPTSRASEPSATRQGPAARRPKSVTVTRSSEEAFFAPGLRLRMASLPAAWARVTAGWQHLHNPATADVSRIQASPPDQSRPPPPLRPLSLRSPSIMTSRIGEELAVLWQQACMLT